MQEPLTNILDFFWDLTYTETGRRTIIIYPETIMPDRYSLRPSNYYPEIDPTLNEWYSPSPPHKRQRAIVLEPGKTDPMRAALLIASLLLENNLLVARTPGMAFDEQLIAIDIMGVVDPRLVNNMRWSDINEWFQIRKKWMAIIERSILPNIYNVYSPQDFYDIFNAITFLGDHKINKK